MRAFVVDAFASAPFTGNPAGVVLLDAPAAPGWMQSVATEFRHSETAFVVARDGGYDLRWFTPAVEVDLCGHATLAAAHVLATTGHDGPFAFNTRSGMLRATVEGDSSIAMDFPAQRPQPINTPPGFAAALGTDVEAVLDNGVDLLAVVGSAGVVAGLRPDIDAVREFECRGVIVTAPAEDGADHDFVSRFFAPRVGVDEDPVTGSAHCALAPYWTDRLGRAVIVGVQLSARGGRVEVEQRGDRVVLRGRAVVVLDGTLRS